MRCSGNLRKEINNVGGVCLKRAIFRDKSMIHNSMKIEAYTSRVWDNRLWKIAVQSTYIKNVIDFNLRDMFNIKLKIISIGDVLCYYSTNFYEIFEDIWSIKKLRFIAFFCLHKRLRLVPF